MSFRSRSRAPASSVDTSHRRSLSSSRVPSSTSTSSYSNYSRPLSSSYYSSASGGSASQANNTSSYYQSPYASIYGSRDNLYNRSSYSNYSPKTSSRYSTSSGNSYKSDRYISPYSSYENGVTTAGLSLSLGASKNGGSSYGSKSSNTTNSYSNTPSYSRNHSRLPNNKSISLSNSSLNSYSVNSPTKTTAPVSVSSSTPTAATIVSRSHSLREQERKGRNRTRSRNIAQRSISASSEKSEGYESGNERTSRSRLGSSTNSLADSDNKKSTENGEVDYKALWEAAMLDNDKLKQQLKKKDEEVEAAKATVERVANATSKNSLSEIEKRERRAMERKFSEMEEELKLLQKLKIENERLRAENRALTRVVSKLTTSAQSQLQNRK